MNLLKYLAYGETLSNKICIYILCM